MNHVIDFHSFLECDVDLRWHKRLIDLDTGGGESIDVYGKSLFWSRYELDGLVDVDHSLEFLPRADRLDGSVTIPYFLVGYGVVSAVEFAELGYFEVHAGQWIENDAVREVLFN